MIPLDRKTRIPYARITFLPILYFVDVLVKNQA